MRILYTLIWNSALTFILQLDDVIDLVIPRGSNKLVSQIKSSTKIPVLGHAGYMGYYCFIHSSYSWPDVVILFL